MLKLFNAFIKAAFPSEAFPPSTPDTPSEVAPTLKTPIPSTPAVKYKRRWGAELYELIFEHGLSIKNYDPHGMTEKLTLAWLTPTARRLRQAFKYCWGPYSMFYSPYETKEAFYAACAVDSGANIIACSLGLWVFFPAFWWLWVIFILGSTGLIIYASPQIDVWDEEYAVRVTPQTWAQKFEDYKQFSFVLNSESSYQLQALQKLKFLDTDFVAHQYMQVLQVRCLEDDYPEWPTLARRHKINFIANTLAESVALNQNPLIYFAELPIRPNFSLKQFRDDVLLLDDARTDNGTCEFFISFAFWAPRTINSRKRYAQFWGPARVFRWPYLYAGSWLREFIMAFFMWMLILGAIALYYAVYLGSKYWLVTLIPVGAGLVGIWVLKFSSESWSEAGVFDLLPPALPVTSIGLRRRYGWVSKFCKTPRYDFGFFLYLWLFTVFDRFK